MAPREGPGQGRQARRPREHPGCGRRGASTATSAPSSSSRARPTSRQGRRLHLAGPGPRRRWSSPRAPTRVAELKHRARRPQDHHQGEHRGRPRRPLRGGRRQRPRHLPAPAGRPRRQRRARRARRRHQGAGPRHRRARRLRQAAVPHPRRGARPTSIEKERQALLDITKAEGKPEQAWPKIVEGRLNAWFKDQVLLEQGFVRGRQAVDHRAPRRRHARPLRPGLHRRLRLPVTDRPDRSGLRWNRVLLKLSGEAFAGEAGYGIDGDGRAEARPRDRRGPPRPRHRRRRRRRRRQHLARHDRRRRRAWTAPRPTTWACWPPSSTAWRCRTRSSSSASPPGCRPPSTWPRSPSPTSGAGPSATSRRAGS